MVIVTFDSKKTILAEIVEKLSKGGHPVSGEPQWVKRPH